MVPPNQRMQPDAAPRPEIVSILNVGINRNAVPIDLAARLMRQALAGSVSDLLIIERARFERHGHEVKWIYQNATCEQSSRKERTMVIYRPFLYCNDRTLVFTGVYYKY